MSKYAPDSPTLKQSPCDVCHGDPDDCECYSCTFGHGMLGPCVLPAGHDGAHRSQMEQDQLNRQDEAGSVTQEPGEAERIAGLQAEIETLKADRLRYQQERDHYRALYLKSGGQPSKGSG